MTKEIQEKLKIIREFAKKMNYEICEGEYREYGYPDGRLCSSIELLGTSDSEGNPYIWAWYLDTGKEME